MKGLRANLALAASLVGALLFALAANPSGAQVPPSTAERAAYIGLHAAAERGDARAITAQATRSNVNLRDGRERTPLHVAAHFGRHEALRALAAAGADINALEGDRYDIVTIAAVANDLATLELALALGCSARNITSRYDGTALIAAAHLGHAEVVRMLIKSGAPLDHINNLGWTAVIEAVVLGDGGSRHQDTLRALLAAGANPNVADRNGQTPLALARARRFSHMVNMISQAGGR